MKQYLKPLLLFFLLLNFITACLCQEKKWGDWKQHPCYKGISYRIAKGDINQGKVTYWYWYLQMKNNYPIDAIIERGMSHLEKPIKKTTQRSKIVAGTIYEDYYLVESNTTVYVFFDGLNFESISGYYYQTKECSAGCDIIPMKPNQLSKEECEKKNAVNKNLQASNQQNNNYTNVEEETNNRNKAVNSPNSQINTSEKSNSATLSQKYNDQNSHQVRNEVKSLVHQAKNARTSILKAMYLGQAKTALSQIGGDSELQKEIDAIEKEDKIKKEAQKAENLNQIETLKSSNNNLTTDLGIEFMKQGNASGDVNTQAVGLGLTIVGKLFGNKRKKDNSEEDEIKAKRKVEKEAREKAEQKKRDEESRNEYIKKLESESSQRFLEVEARKIKAENGDAEAQYKLAFNYKDGEGVEKKDIQRYIYWMRKSAENGYLLAQNNLALAYYNGIGIPVDVKMAVFWFKKAAEGGNIGAQFNLALFYETGDDGIPIDKKQAVYWYQKAAEKDFDLAQYKLGKMYYEGDGVTIDKVFGLNWLKKAAAQGEKSAIEYLKKIGQ